jgi:hypothetical protein
MAKYKKRKEKKDMKCKVTKIEDVKYTSGKTGKDVEGKRLHVTIEKAESLFVNPKYVPIPAGIQPGHIINVDCDLDGNVISIEATR